MTTPVNANAPSFEHVLRLTDERGMFEHADGTTPRRDGGYCLDDVARALVVVCRQRPATSTLDRLATTYLAFVRRAQAPDGHSRGDIISCNNVLAGPVRWSLVALLPRPNRSELLNHFLLEFVQGFRAGHRSLLAGETK